MLRRVLLIVFLLCLLHFGRASLSFHESGKFEIVPLKALHVQGEFFDSFGEVIVRQVWTNNYVNPLTSKYKFSLDTSAVVSGFEMKIGNQSWTGVVKEKNTARENFNEAVASGKKSSILEKISDNEYQVEIGPIPPSETAEVEFHYLTHAVVQLDGSYRFVLPTNIAPKYINPSAATNQVDKEYSAKMASTPYASQPPYTFDVDLTWRTGSALRGIVSATNEIHTELLSATAVRVRCTTAPENGDFSLLVTTASTTGTYSYQNEEGTTFLYVHNQIPTEAVPSSVSAKKITIVVDRSGSMEWQKISEAVAAIDQFLSLLPPNADTLINVVSFGSHFDALYSHSVPATAENIDKIRQSVRTFQANYGGTELSRCLKAVAAGSALPSGTASEARPEPVDMEHVIVLLTNGQVYDVHEIMTYLSEQKTTTNFRIMSVGIGRDADRKLVEQVADTTHGLSRMLTDETDLTRALTDILAYIDKQYYTDVKVLDYEASQCSQVLYPAHPVDMFLRLLPAQYQQVVANGLTISAKDPVHRGSMKVWHLPVDKTVKAGRLLEKLYADHTISQLSQQIVKMDKFSNVQRDIAHLTESIVALSVKHGIMNKHTSFLVISDEKIDPDQLAKVQHVEVPQHENHPYGTISGGSILLAMGGSSAIGGSVSFTSGSFVGTGSISIASGSSAPGAGGSIGLSLQSGAASFSCASISTGFTWEADDAIYLSSGSSFYVDDDDSASIAEDLILTSTGSSNADNGAVVIGTGSDSKLSGNEVIITPGSGSGDGKEVMINSGSGYGFGNEVVINSGSGSELSAGKIVLGTGTAHHNNLPGTVDTTGVVVRDEGGAAALPTAASGMINLSTGAATSVSRGFIGYLSSTGTSARPRGGAVYIQVGDTRDTDASPVDGPSKGAPPSEAILSGDSAAVTEAADKRGPPLIPGSLISPDDRTAQITYLGGGKPSETARTAAGAPSFLAGMVHLSTGAASTGNSGYVSLGRSSISPQPGDIILQVGHGHITHDHAGGSTDVPGPISPSGSTEDRPAAETGVPIQRSKEPIDGPASEHQRPVAGAIRIKERSNAEVDLSVRIVESPHNFQVESHHADRASFNTAKKPAPVGVFEHVAQWVSQHTSEIFIVCVIGAALALLLLDTFCCAVDDK